MTGERLLVIDDDVGVRAIVAQVASDLGLEVYTNCGDHMLEAVFSEAAPHRVFLDLAMPGRDGIEVIKLLASQRFSGGLIISSGAAPRVMRTALALARGLGLPNVVLLEKPVLIEQLEEALRQPLAGGRAPNRPRELSLARALADGSLYTVFQPEFALRPNAAPEMRRVEALIRWRDKDQGDVPVPVILRRAEEEQLMEALTLFVTEKMCVQLAEWQANGFVMDGAVNFAPQLLTHLDLPDRLSRIARTHGIDPGRILFELTETGATTDILTATELLTRLRLKGFGLAMDDFGTGHSSLVQLYRMPFDQLKIDRSFVSGCQSSEDARTIIDATVGLAHRLGLVVCAEGVEETAELEFLQQAGCDLVQGYLLARPVRGEDILAMHVAMRGGQPPKVSA